MAVDIARRPYTTRARFFRNSPLEIQIKWTPADPKRGTFPGVSKICSLDWVTHPETADGVGEVYGAPRRFNYGRVTPVDIGAHFCGTLDDHRNGEVLDPGCPPQEYWPSGLSKCCDPARREAVSGVGMGGVSQHTTDRVYRSMGGVGIGSFVEVIGSDPYRRSGGVGLSAVARSLRSDPFYSLGGVGLGGESHHLLDGPRYSLGGVGLGGESETLTEADPDVCPIPAPLCSLAPSGSLNHMCQRLWFRNVRAWLRWSVVPGRTYQFRSGAGNAQNYGTEWRIWEGEACGAFNEVDSGGGFPHNTTWTFTATGHYVWLEMYLDRAVSQPTYTVGVFDV